MTALKLIKQARFFMAGTRVCGGERIARECIGVLADLSGQGLLVGLFSTAMRPDVDI
jgi:hypothetical protein